MLVEEFLDTKTLYYDEIDYTRMPRVYEKIKSKLPTPKIIHILGTNGKGTTGRFLATAIFAQGKSVGHYTSPHILKFNERIWLNGSEISDEDLNKAHRELLGFLPKEDADALSYFEYTTLLAMHIYRECEYVVLEAGLGGEHDATAVFPKTLTLVTPIDLDHEAFLGSSIEEISRTKLNAITKQAIINKQEHESVYKVALELEAEKSIIIRRVEKFIDESDNVKIVNISQELMLAEYLVSNLRLAIAALNFLNIEYKESDFKESQLFGRLSHFAPNILVDVGHNVLAARKIEETLKSKKYVLVYNSYKDKDFKNILLTLKPIIDYVEIIAIEGERAASQEILHETLRELEITYKQFNKIEQKNNYLVFGSFAVVESFLKAVSG